MKRLNIFAVLFTVTIALSSVACIGAENLKQLSSNGITVSYPEGLEAQAKRVMAVAKTSIKPSLDVHRQTTALLSDVDSMSKDITQMLGADEKQDLVKTRLQSFKNKSLSMIATFSNIRLVRKGNVVATEGLDCGIMQLRYSKEKDEFNIHFDEQDTSPEKLKRSFFPVVINSDGSIRSESKLGKMALDFLGAGDAMAIAPVQDTISYLIVEQLKIYNPLARWFNEGVSGWMTRRIVAKYNPKLNNLANTLFSVNAKSQELKDKVNLLAWSQSAYVNKDKSVFDPDLEIAKTQYSIELISNLLTKTGPQALPKIMNGLNYVGSPNTDAICEAIKKTTDIDFKPIFMNYVPNDIRNGIATGKSVKLVSKAQELLEKKKWEDSADTLRQALEIAPDDVNIRLNLAWIEREFNERRDSEMQIFLTAGLLKQQKYSFHMYASSIEGNYVMGRLAILLGNLDSAKQFLEPVLAYRPNHADAKRAMDDIEKLETAVKGTN